MSIVNYVQERVKSLKKEKSSITKKHDIIDVISIALAALGIGVGVLCCFSALWNITFPCIGFGLGMVSLNDANRKKANARKKRLNNEMKHLENITKSPFDVSDEKLSKRSSKVSALSEFLKGANENVHNGKVSDALLTISLAGATALGIAFGGVMTVVPMVVAAIKGINDAVSIKKVEEREVLKNRVDNLKNDLDIQTRVIAASRHDASAIPNPTIVQTLNKQNAKAKTVGVDKNAYVDAYVENLAKTPAEVGYQKVKR